MEKGRGTYSLPAPLPLFRPANLMRSVSKFSWEMNYFWKGIFAKGLTGWMATLTSGQCPPSWPPLLGMGQRLLNPQTTSQGKHVAEVDPVEREKHNVVHTFFLSQTLSLSPRVVCLTGASLRPYDKGDLPHALACESWPDSSFSTGSLASPGGLILHSAQAP